MNDDDIPAQFEDEAAAAAPLAARENTSAFWPLVLLAASLICIFVYQLLTLSEQRDNLRAMQEQMEAAYSKSVPQQEQLLAQSKAVQEKLKGLVTDLLHLADSGDADAKAIVEKYKITEAPNAPAAGASGASASPSTTTP